MTDVEACKKMLFRVALKHGIPPKLISERLLSKEDKEDMLGGVILFESLDCAVRVWKEHGLCNYADGSGAWYDDFGRYAPKGWWLGEKVATIANLPHCD